MKIKEECKKDYEKFENNNQDFYGAGVIRFTERWADAMEEEIERIGTISFDKARGLSYKCDTEGITGFMFGCAKSILKQWWLHSDIFTREEWQAL